MMCIVAACVVDDETEPLQGGTTSESPSSTATDASAAADTSTGAPRGSSSDGGSGSSGPGHADSTSGGAATDDTGSESSSGTIPPSDECIAYCDEFLPNCNEIRGIQAYDGLTDCLTTCAPWPEGPPGEFSGNTVQCRIAQLTFDPNPGPGYYELHCFHAQQNPTSQCV
ncbi:MAG: hypothetical protein K0V04_38420 [Deltaproteobacteria bacterium]|nr:hypothetical protein [Deltaproteobacteria bacterium]